MRGLVLLCALLALTEGFVYQSGVSFTGNYTGSNWQVDPRFWFRKHFVHWYGEEGALVDVSVQVSGQQGNAEANGIFNVLKIGSLASPAVADYPFLASVFFNVSAQANVSLGSIVADLEESAAMVGFVLTTIEEVTSSGTVVATYDFSGVNWAVAKGVTIVSNVTELAYASFTASLGTNGGTFAFTASVSGVVGVLSNGGAVITPSTVETFIEVNGYVYANVQNNLRAVGYVVHATEQASVEANGKIVAGSGAAQAYAYFSSNVQDNNGTTHNVVLSGVSSGTITVNNLPVGSQFADIVALYSTTLKVDVRKVQVDFPAGLTSFTYDPAVGYGDASNPQAPSSPTSAPTTAPTHTPNAAINIRPSWILGLVAIFFFALIL